MKKQLLILLALLAIIPFANVQAQCPTDNKAFQAGETINYNLYFNWHFIWKKVGAAQFTIQNATYNKQPGYKLKLLNATHGAADKFFKMRDTLESYINAKLVPIYYRKGADEGGRYAVDEVWYTYSGGKTHVKQHRLRPDKDPIELSTDHSYCVYDMLSIVSWARSMDLTGLTEGKEYDIYTATGRDVEKQRMIYKGKKEIKDEHKNTYRCMVFAIVGTKKGKDRELMKFYVTDDENKLPICLDLALNFGSAKAILKNFSGNRHPVTAKTR